LSNNKLINEKLICAFRWSVLSSVMKMHGSRNKIRSLITVFAATGILSYWLCWLSASEVRTWSHWL